MVKKFHHEKNIRKVIHLPFLLHFTTTTSDVALKVQNKILMNFIKISFTSGLKLSIQVYLETVDKFFLYNFIKIYNKIYAQKKKEKQISPKNKYFHHLHRSYLHFIKL